MPAWIIALLMPLALLGNVVAASFACTTSGTRKLRLYAIALSIAVVAVLAVVYMTVRETWPESWGPTLATTAASLLALYVVERRLRRNTEPDLPPA